MEPIKYPRTFHLPWSESVSSDDKVLQSLGQFEGEEVVVTEKMDGENTTMYRNHIHARSLDSKGGEDRAWVKQFWSSFCRDIPEGWRICGENLWAKHSVAYTQLPSFFLGFSVWDANNEALSWEETQEWFNILGITSVPTLYQGKWNEKAIRSLWNSSDKESKEGYVVRLARSFRYEEFSTSVGKFVRKGHVQTDKHWRSSVLVPNSLV